MQGNWYELALLDRREGSEAQTVNDRVFAAGPVHGINVAAMPWLAARCADCIVAQHTGVDRARKIEAALTWALPPRGAILAAARPTLDAFGAMAVLAMRADGVEFTPDVCGRVQQIAAADQPESQWRPDRDVDAVSDCQALQAVARDARRDVTARVETVGKWLETGEFPARESAAHQVRRERARHADLYRRVRLVADGRIAVIESKSPHAITVAYYRAPVVVAIKPKHAIKGGERPRKVAICQQTSGHIAIVAVRDELNAIQPGWDGKSNMIGSPVGEHAAIPLESLVAVVERHLLSRPFHEHGGSK